MIPYQGDREAVITSCGSYIGITEKSLFWFDMEKTIFG